MRIYGADREATNVSTTLRGAQILVANTRVFWVLECGVFNTTTTACTAGLQRFTASGTAGGTYTFSAEDASYTPNATGNLSVSTNMTATGQKYTNASLGAAVGAGVIWTFGGKGITVPGTASNGICLITPNGTGQFRDFYFVVEE